jgi:ribonuclease HII
MILICEKRPSMDPSIEELLAKPLADLRKRLLVENSPAPSAFLDALERDSRSGARQMAHLLRERRLKSRREEQRLQSLLQFERELWAQGIHLIAGVDEAGMAPLAGPVVAAAVILPFQYKLCGLNDSKKIADARKRESLARQIKEDAVCWSTGLAEPAEIDELNIYHAGLLAMERAVEGLDMRPAYVLVDARTIPHCPYPQKGIVKGDALSASIAAASIIAKTTRDAHMIRMDRIYSGYGFASHKGYPTPMHLRALKERGVLPIHRQSFAPVREVLCLVPLQVELFGKSHSA